MTDFSGFAGLDDELTGLIGEWVSTLEREMPAVLAWWDGLQARLNTGGIDVAHVHWPAGPVSHPRVIALYRAFHLRVEAINARREAPDEDDPPADELWLAGDGGDEDDGLEPISPVLLLRDMMVDYAPALGDLFLDFDFIPIGETDDGEPC